MRPILLILFTAGALHAESPAPMNPLNPASVAREWGSRWRAGTFIAPDGTSHRRLGDAIRRAVLPTDMGLNVRSALVSKAHPLSLLNIWLASFSVELQRQLASGKGLDAGRLVDSLTDYRSILGGFVGWAAADAAGAVIQSTLARTGLAGGIAGFVLRQALAFSGFLLGMNIGDNTGKGLSARAILAEAIRRFEPMRDIGQTFGYGMGAVAGQFAIPFFPVGSVVGGIAGGTLGALLGNALAQSPLKPADGRMRSWIEDLARRIDDRPPRAERTPAAPAPVTSVTPRATVATSPSSGLDADDLILRD